MFYRWWLPNSEDLRSARIIYMTETLQCPGSTNVYKKGGLVNLILWSPQIRNTSIWISRITEKVDYIYGCLYSTFSLTHIIENSIAESNSSDSASTALSNYDQQDVAKVESYIENKTTAPVYNPKDDPNHPVVSTMPFLISNSPDQLMFFLII